MSETQRVLVEVAVVVMFVAAVVAIVCFASSKFGAAEVAGIVTIAIGTCLAIPVVCRKARTFASSSLGVAAYQGDRPSQMQVRKR